jgi:hypothetical protein
VSLQKEEIRGRVLGLHTYRSYGAKTGTSVFMGYTHPVPTELKPGHSFSWATHIPLLTELTQEHLFSWG